ncbi:MAG TPA: CvpA family protein, partial [Candidatus Jeotgalibaca merdavium]|nr:CvpA family protein [Candidatus Jeotgalibaca merdavium]
MLTIIILLLLCMGVYAGVRRGLVLQLVHTAGYIISFYFAQQYYLQLAEYLEMLVPY